MLKVLIASTMRAVAALAIAALPMSCAWSQTPYPGERTIKMIVPYGPGGGNDTIARVIADLAPRYLGATMIVENRPGGSNGAIGTTIVATAKPDGYTLLFAAPDNITVEPNVAQHSYTYKSFAPIVRSVIMPVYLVAGPGAKATTVKEMVAYARAHPEDITIGVSGMASPSELGARRVFEALGGVPVQFVPFKGSGEINTAVLGGHIQMTLLPEGAIAQYIKSGKVKALMSLSHQSTSFPEVPGIDALGLNVLPYEQWGMVFAPAGTPEPIVEFLRSRMVELMKDPVFDTRLRAAGITPAPLASAKELEDILSGENQSFAAVVKKFNLQR